MSTSTAAASKQLLSRAVTSQTSGGRKVPANTIHALDERQYPVAVDALIENAHLAKDEDRQFRELCRGVFTVHSVNIPPLEAPQWPPVGEFSSPSLPPSLPSWLNYRFHTSHYRRPDSLRQGLTKLDAEVPVDDLLRRLRADVRPGAENVLTFLVGPVGAGKTTLVSNIVTREGRDWLEAQRKIVVRLDLGECFNNTFRADDPPHNREKAYVLFFIQDQLFKAYQNAKVLPQAVLDEILEKTGIDRHNHDTRTAEALLRAMIERLSKPPDAATTSITLIIDNLDFLYHEYDRGLFAREAMRLVTQTDEELKELEEQRLRAHNLLVHIIKALHLDRSALRLAGLNVLIVMREDSLEHYQSIRFPGSPDPRNETYRLDVPDIGVFVDAHVSLIEEAARRWPIEWRSKVYQKAVSQLDFRALSPTEEATNTSAVWLHQDLLNLSRQGLRQLTEHYSRYIWLPVTIGGDPNKYEITQRFQDQYFPGMISYIQNGNRLFSQFSAEFPNVYLVRGDHVKNRHKPWSILARPHKHSYWLKRLMLEYIAQRQKAGSIVSPSHIYETFCTSEGGLQAYEPWIVALCLGSMAEVNKSHVIDFQFAPNNDTFEVQQIMLSNRGWRLLGYVDGGATPARDFFIDSFTYLQVIVDDYIMLFPRSMLPHFAYDGLDYGYFSASPSEYGAMAKRMVVKKIRQVAVFLDILEIALRYERMAFGAAFARMEDAINIPSMSEIRSRFKSSIRGLTAYLGIAYEDCVLDSSTYLPPLSSDLARAYGVES
jgi:hypothetical protein